MLFTNHRTLLLALTALLAVSACRETEFDPCPAGTVASGQACLAQDAGLDASDAARDAGPCNGVCAGNTPLCLEDGGTCVTCLADSDCTAPEASRCEPESHTCRPCASHGDCIGISDGRDKCDLTRTPATCVECMPATEQNDCGDKSCDPKTLACGPHDRETRGVCESCISDSDCVANHRCVPMTFGEPAEAHGSYCLQIGPDCPRPYRTRIDAESVSGEAEQGYCGIVQTLTTCEATLALEDSRECAAAGDPTPCAEKGAICRDLQGGFDMNRCTYQCATGDQCPDGLGCGVKGGGPDYCGGKTR